MPSTHTVTPRLGAEPLPGGTRFSLFCTTATACEVQLHDGPARRGRRIPMQPGPDGLFSVVVPGVGHGALYTFVVGERELPDPFARFLPHGVHGPAMVVEPRAEWRHGPGVVRPLREHVIYELHVGTFTDEGTYQAARRHLGDLVELGVTALELMPVASFD